MLEGPSAKKFQSLLYRLYSTGQRLAWILKRRVTVLGTMVLFLIPVVMVLTVLYGKGALFQLISVLCGGLVVSFWLVLFRGGKVKIEREMPKLASVGEEVVYTVHYRNMGRGTLKHFLLEDFPVDPCPSKSLFLNSKEPGEEMRNGFDRLFIAYRWMWLVSRRILFESKTCVVEDVKRDEVKQCQMVIVPQKRGVAELGNMRVILPDPFGIFQRAKKAIQKVDHLIVLPKRYRIPRLDLPGNSRNQVGGEAMSMISGDAGEFVGLREYRAGDPIRHIHWPSWARMGKPIVKEYEDVFFPRYGLFLDTAVPVEKELVFEESVSVAASFASAVDTKECLLDLIFVQQGAKVMTVGRGEAKVEKMLETLAGVENDLEPCWDELNSMVLKHGDGLTACIVVLSHWSEERKEMLGAWIANGLNLKIIYLCEDLEIGKNDVKEGGFEIQVIEIGRIEQSLMVLR